MGQLHYSELDRILSCVLKISALWTIYLSCRPTIVECHVKVCWYSSQYIQHHNQNKAKWNFSMTQHCHHKKCLLLPSLLSANNSLWMCFLHWCKQSSQNRVLDIQEPRINMIYKMNRRCKCGGKTNRRHQKSCLSFQYRGIWSWAWRYSVIR